MINSSKQSSTKRRISALPTAAIIWHVSHQTNTCHAFLDDQKTFVAAMTSPAPHPTTRRFRLLGPALLMFGGAFVC
jgi:hypothetical protein